MEHEPEKCMECGNELNSLEILYCHTCLNETSAGADDNTCAGCGKELECFEVIYCYGCIAEYEHCHENLAEIEV